MSDSCRSVHDSREAARPAVRRFPAASKAWSATAHAGWSPTARDDPFDEPGDPDEHRDSGERHDRARLGKHDDRESSGGRAPTSASSDGSGSAFERIAFAPSASNAARDPRRADEETSLPADGNALRRWRVLVMGLLGGLVGLAVGASLYQFGPTVGVAVDVPAAVPVAHDDGVACALAHDCAASRPAPALMAGKGSLAPNVERDFAPIAAPAERVTCGRTLAQGATPACTGRDCAERAQAVDATPCDGSVAHE